MTNASHLQELEIDLLENIKHSFHDSCFLTLPAQVVTQTLDPFSGVVYARPASSFRQPKRRQGGVTGCRAQGRGRHTVQLTVQAGECGWSRQGALVRLDMYVQYDGHVQQVVDEQLTVECDMATREGRVVSMGSREREGGVGVPVHASQSVRVSASLGQGFVHRAEEEEEEEREEEEREEEEIEIKEEEEREEDTVESNEVDGSQGWRVAQELPQRGTLLEEVVVGGRLREEQVVVLEEEEPEMVFLEKMEQNYEEPKAEDRKVDESVSLVGWLELTQGGLPGGGLVEEKVRAGEVVRLVARVGGRGAEHSRLGECRLQEGDSFSAGETVEGGRRLTDHRGCGLGEVATSWSSVSGVRQLSARLQVPAVQGGRMLVTCRVVACRGPCPAQPCRGEEVVQGQLQGGVTLQVEARVGRGEEGEVHTGAHRHREGEGLLEQLQVTI